MAMKPCTKCLENRWGGWEHLEGGYIRATCQMCGYEVEWLPWKPNATPRIDKAPHKITKEGQPCRKCGTAVERKSHRQPPPYRAGGYYFKSWLACPNKRCRTLYMLESEKVMFDSEPEKHAHRRNPYTSPVMFPTAPDDPNFAPRPDNVLPWEERA